MQYKTKTETKTYTKSMRFNLDVEKLSNQQTKSSFQQDIMVKLNQMDIQSRTTNASYNEINL